MTGSKPIRFGVRPPQAESAKPQNPLAGDPTTTTLNYYTDPTGSFFSGVWESTPGKWPVDYTEAEFCALLEGRVVLTGADGSSESFGPGDAFVIPAGFQGTWETLEPCRKLYAIFQPPSPEPLKKGDTLTVENMRLSPSHR